MDQNNPYFKYMENREEENNNGDKGIDATEDLQNISKSDEEAELKASNEILLTNKILISKKWYDLLQAYKRDNTKCEQYKPTQEKLNAKVMSEVTSQEKTNDKEFKYMETINDEKHINVPLETPLNHNVMGHEFNGVLLERDQSTKYNQSYIKSEDAKDTADKEDTEARLDNELKILNRKIDEKKRRLYELILERKRKEELKYQLQKKNRKTLLEESPESASLKGPIGNIVEISMVEMSDMKSPIFNLFNSTGSSNNKLTSDQNVTNSEENIEMEKSPLLSKASEHIANQKSSEYLIPLDMEHEDPSQDYEGIIFKLHGCSDNVKDENHYDQICEAIPLHGKNYSVSHLNNSSSLSANRHTPESKGLAGNHGDKYTYQKETDRCESENSQTHDNNVCQVCRVQEANYICTGCRKQWYCSTICQFSDWERHIKHCDV